MAETSQESASTVKIIAIGGGSGSGKSTLADALRKGLHPTTSVIMELDRYYRDLSHLPLDERKSANVDVPDMIDFNLMSRDLSNLKLGNHILSPIYDFATHTRLPFGHRLESQDVIIVEGIFALYHEAIRRQADLCIWVGADSEVRKQRRLERDVVHRGRTVECVGEQWQKTVEPMFQRLVEPTSGHAHLVVSGENLEGATDMIITELLRHQKGI